MTGPYAGSITSIMDHEQDPLRLRIDQIERMLRFEYEPGNDDALFDICDHYGHIVKTGAVNGRITEVAITELDGEDYYLMVLDGDISTLKPFQLRRPL